MSTWSARHDPPNNNSNSPLGIDTELKGKRRVIEKVVVKNLKLFKPDINNQVEKKEMEKDPTLNQLNGTDDMEEDMWLFPENFYDSPPQSPPMSPSAHDWSGEEEEELALTRLEASPTLSREEFEEFIEKENEKSAANLEILRRQFSPDRPSDMNCPQAERTIGLEILSQLSPDRPLDIENAQRPLENPTGSSQGCRFSATTGPLTPGDVFWGKEPPPPPLTPHSSPPSIRSTRSTSCRLSISSSASSISPVKIPKVGRKTRQTRRTKEAMNAMSSLDKEDMKRERNKFHARDSAARKKDEMAGWERRVRLLELKLSESTKNNRQLEIGDFNVAIEAARTLNRFKLNDEISKIESDLAEIETKKAKKELKATTRASQKCRANAKLKMAKLKLRALDLLAKVDMEQTYGRKLMGENDENLENTSTESEAELSDSASADSLPTCQPDGTYCNDKSFGGSISQHRYYDTPPPITTDQMYHSSIAAQSYNATIYNGQATSHTQTACDGYNGPLTEKQMECSSVDAPRFNGAPVAPLPELMGGAYNGHAPSQQFTGGLAPQQDLPPPYNSTVYDGQAICQQFGGTTHNGQIAAASHQFRGPVTQYGHHGVPSVLPEQRGAAANQTFGGPAFQHGHRDAPLEHAGFTSMSNQMNNVNLNGAQCAVDVVSRYEETFGESPDDVNHEKMDVDDAVWQPEDVNAFPNGAGYSNMPNQMNYTNFSAPMSQEKNQNSASWNQAPAA